MRFQNIHFRPDWEFVVDQVIKHVITLPGVNASNLALWGRSFGGYLTPRACAYEPRLLACVADGGVLDFYQSVVCSLDDNLRDLYYNDQPKFNKYLKYGANFSLGARFLLSYGKLGFASTSPSDLLNQFSACVRCLRGIDGIHVHDASLFASAACSCCLQSGTPTSGSWAA